MAASVQLWHFSVKDYHRMLESGILHEDDRVELIDGVVREMSPINSWHASTVKRLNHLLGEKLRKRAMVSVQDPIVLDDYTEPQPDLILLKWRDDYYAEQLPNAEDALVVIEVADTTLHYDRQEKLPRYAAAGIPEVWIVEAGSETVEQYVDPQGSEYRDKKVIARGERLVCRSIVGLEIDGVEILGAKRQLGFMRAVHAGRVTLRWLLIVTAIIATVIGLVRARYAHMYPYGRTHACDLALYFELTAYADANNGFFPAGEATPEAALSLIGKNKPNFGYMLAGKTASAELAEELLLRGKLLDPDTCSWHYVEGLHKNDNPKLALFWDKIGLGHNGERKSDSGHSVCLLGGDRIWVSKEEWLAFLEEQRTLLPNRSGITPSVLEQR